MSQKADEPTIDVLITRRSRRYERNRCALAASLPIPDCIDAAQLLLYPYPRLPSEPTNWSQICGGYPLS